MQQDWESYQYPLGNPARQEQYDGHGRLVDPYMNVHPNTPQSSSNYLNMQHTHHVYPEAMPGFAPTSEVLNVSTMGPSMPAQLAYYDATIHAGTMDYDPNSSFLPDNLPEYYYPQTSQSAYNPSPMGAGIKLMVPNLRKPDRQPPPKSSTSLRGIRIHHSAYHHTPPSLLRKEQELIKSFGDPLLVASLQQKTLKK